MRSALVRSAPLAVVACLALGLTGGCRRKPVCHGELEKDDLFRMQESVHNGVEPCPEHERPTVVVDANAVVLNARAVAPRSSLPVGNIKRVDGLFVELKMAREIWKMLHPALAFEPRLTAVLDPDLDAFAGASVLQSAAFAGFIRMHVETGGVTFDAYWAVPGPPSPDGEPPETIQVRRTPQDWYEFRFEGESKKPRPLGGATRDVTALLAELASACESRQGACAQVLEIRLEHGSFLQLAQLVRSLMASAAFSRRWPALRLAGPGN